METRYEEHREFWQRDTLKNIYKTQVCPCLKAEKHREFLLINSNPWLFPLFIQIRVAVWVFVFIKNVFDERMLFIKIKSDRFSIFFLLKHVLITIYKTKSMKA